MSVASATDPSITYDNDGATPSNSITLTGAKWGDKTGVSIGTDSGDFFQLQDSSNNVIKNLTLTFDKLTDPNNTPTQGINSNTLTITGNGQVNANETIFTFSNKGNANKGILLGNSDTDRGTLTFNFLGSEGASTDSNWNGSNETKKRKVVLDLSDSTTLTTSNQKVSLVGNILIKAGMGIRNPDDLNQPRPNHQSVTNTNVFEATFGGDVIGDITINPSDINDPKILRPNGTSYYTDTKYRDITSTFTFNDGASLKGSIIANTGNNTFSFTNGNIVGNITADNGTPSNDNSWSAGSENEYYGAINKITFSGTSGNITGNITASNAGQNIITFNTNTTATIQNSTILSGRTDTTRISNANHNNFIVFKGGSANITNSSLQIVNYAGGELKFSNNILLSSSATTTNIQLSSMSVRGDYGPSNPANKTFNIIDLEGSNNSLTIDSISSTFGNNIIAKGLVSADSKTGFSTTLNSVYYNDNFFEVETANLVAYKVYGIKLKDNIATEFLKSDYSVKGDFVIGTDNKTNAINTEKGGVNLINISGNTTIKGNIVSSVKYNQNASGHNNLLVLTGTSATIGESGNEISIKADNTPSSSDGKYYDKYSTNTLLLGASSNALYLNTLLVAGDGPNVTQKAFNALSFNNSTDSSNSATIDSVSASCGANIVGKNLITQSNGYNAAMFGSANIPEIQSGFLTEFEKSTHTAQGTFTISSISAGSGGANYINVDQVSVTGDITANSGGNYIVAGTFNGSGKVIATGNGNNSIQASNGTAIFEGISTETQAVSGNTIDLGSGSITINTRSGGSADGKAVYAWNGDNSNSITASNIVVNGDIVAGGGVSSAKSLNSFTGSNITIIGNIAGNSNNENNFTLNADSATLTLNGKTTGGTTHQITSLTATTIGTNTLTLDNSASSITDGSIQTTIDSVTNGQNLAVILNAKSATESVSLSFTNATNLKSVTLAGAKGNVLTFNAGTNSVTDKITVESTQDLTLNLAGATTSLNLAGGLTGEAKISINSSNPTALSGGAISGASLTFADTTKLTLQNTSAVFTAVDALAGSATLGIGGGDNAVNATINALKGGNNLSVAFNGANDKSATLKIQGVDSGTALNLAGVSMGTNSKNNTLDLSELDTSITSINFGSAIAVGSSGNTQGLSINVKGLNSDNAGRTIAFTDGTTITDGALNLTILDGNATLSATANSINLSNLNISSTGTAPTVAFESDTTIGNLTAQTNSNLVIGKASATATLSIGTTNSTLDSVELKGDNTALEINGGTQTINTLTLNASANALNLTNDNLTIGKIEDQNMSFNVVLNNSTLSLAGDINKIDSLEVKNNALINLAVGHNGTNKATQVPSKVRNTLTIGELNGNLSANIFVNKSQADQIVINDATQADTTLTLYARGNASEIVSITREDNVLAADTSNNGAKDKVNVIGGVSDLGGLVVELTVDEEKDASDVGTGKWYVGKSVVKGVDTSFQEVASTALAVNYDLYLANFNSLNKRMGELRDNPYSNGVWARVFGGAMSNDFGAGSKTEYVTAQAGYDYSLSVGENAKNFIGIALAYGSSWTKANEGVGLTTALLDNINSQMVEVGIYNSYVMDSGWYNDTIFKFDYIMSDFDISVSSGGSSTHSTNNFAMVLSDEFGYRYKFAENEKGNWYIDPQVEVAFGYFNQSDFNQAIADNFTTVEASQDAILTLRTRAGLSLGKKFNTERGFASLYVGAFYEYDYIEGGNAQTQTLGISNTLDKLESNGRAIVNIGSNIGLTESARLYIDVEKSFGDKQRTFMQFNLGARYSF